MGRRGIAGLDDLIPYLILIIVGVIIFLLFLLQARQLKGAYLSQSITASTIIQSGATVLQVYFSTPLNTSREVFLPSQLDEKLGAIPSVNLLILDAWASTDKVCLAWMEKHGKNYFDSKKGWSDDPDLYHPPSPACGALFYRTLLFFHTLCASDFFLSVEAPAGTVYLGRGLRPEKSHSFQLSYHLTPRKNRLVEFFARTNPSKIKVPLGAHLLFGTQTASTPHGLVTARFHCFAEGVSQ